MQSVSKKRMSLALAGSALAGLWFPRATSAQTAGVPATGAPGATAGGIGGRGQGRQGGFIGRMPFASGTITGGSAANRTITVKSQSGGSQTIQLTAGTKIYTQTTVTVANLKVDDQVKVAGVPTAITADTLTAGEIPDFLQPPNRNRTRGAAGNPAAPQDPNGQDDGTDPNAGAPAKVEATASANGKVTALEPLTIALSKEVSIVLKMARNAKITRIAVLPFSDLKVGDKLVAAGTMGADGTFSATGIAVNIDPASGLGIGAMGFGPGGFGGFGGFGPGGTGGGFNPNGGPGGGFGGRGGRRNRGGNANGGNPGAGN